MVAGRDIAPFYSGHVIGVLADALPWLRESIENELNSANDNPIIDAEGERVLYGGHFYGGHIGFAMPVPGLMACSGWTRSVKFPPCWAAIGNIWVGWCCSPILLSMVYFTRAIAKRLGACWHPPR